MYQMLKDPLYLYFLEHPEHVNKSHVFLGEQTGLTRQTIATKRERALEEANKHPLPIADFHHEEKNNNRRAIKILFDLEPSAYTSLKVTANMLDMQSKYLSPYWQQVVENYQPTVRGVYGIFANEQLIYIGSSDNLLYRIEQHQALINNPTSIKNELGEYYCEHPEYNYTIRVIDCEFITSRRSMLQLEKDLIKFLQPCCNTMSK